MVEVGTILTAVAYMDAAEPMQSRVHGDGRQREIAFAVSPEIFHGADSIVKVL